MSDEKEALVSVIVPVYKTEKYLEDCMRSILQQDYPALEVLLIDDGSPDGCPALCDSLRTAISFWTSTRKDKVR